MLPNNRPIIIGGCHRSGTSLIRRVLNAHSHIHCGPEVKFFRDFFGDYFDDPLAHGRFATTARSLLPESELFDLLGGTFVSLHERAAARVSKPRWADKNPENVIYLGEWRRLLGNEWVFVHIVRNPLDTLSSMKEKSFPLTLPTSLEQRVSFYRRYTESGVTFGDLYPDQYFRIYYEQLTASPEFILQNLMKCLGEKFEAGQLEFNRFDHQVGLEDPKIGSTTEVHSESVGRWRHTLTVDEARMIWNGTSDLWGSLDPDHQFLGCNSGTDLLSPQS